MIDCGAIVRAWLTAAVSAPAASTLSAEVSATAGTLSVADGSGFPNQGEFVVVVESELVLVTRVGNVLTVAAGRGRLGSVAALHSSGVAVSQGTLYSVVGERVWREPPADNDSPGVWFQMMDEAPRSTAPYFEADVMIRCFGGSGEEIDAKIVYRLLHDRVHAVANESTAHGRLVSANQVGGGRVMVDPDVEWHFVPLVCEVEGA